MKRRRWEEPPRPWGRGWYLSPAAKTRSSTSAGRPAPAGGAADELAALRTSAAEAGSWTPAPGPVP